MHQPIALNIFRQNADVFIVIHHTENLVIRVGSDINQRNIFIIVFNFSVFSEQTIIDVARLVIVYLCKNTFAGESRGRYVPLHLFFHCHFSSPPSLQAEPLVLRKPCHRPPQPAVFLPYSIREDAS